MATRIRIRPATANDAAIIAWHRVAMFRDMGQVPTAALERALLEASRVAIAMLLADGHYVGWLAVDEHDLVIGGAGIHIKPHLPHVVPGADRIATADVPLVVNAYTEPAWRRRGIARSLMHELMRWCEAQGADRVVLHASDEGRALYAGLGFEPTNEMRWTPNSHAAGGG